jgi:hypothetical protein
MDRFEIETRMLKQHLGASSVAQIGIAQREKKPTREPAFFRVSGINRGRFFPKRQMSVGRVLRHRNGAVAHSALKDLENNALNVRYLNT